MSNGTLIALDYTQLPSTQIGSDETYNELAKSGEFLQRLQLFTKGKAIDKGFIRPGHYGIPVSAEEIEDLGDTIDIVPFARKPKAIDMTDKEAIIVSHDSESPEFRRIAEQAQQKESSCMYGPSFLVFERSTAKFYELFCGNKSTRGEAKKIYPFLPLSAAEIESRNLVDQKPHGPLPLTLKSRLVEKGSFSWHVPVVLKCSVPFDNLPTRMDVVVREVQKFLTITNDGVERVEEPVGKKSRAR